LAKKQTYRQKHLNKLAAPGDESPQQERRQRVPIDPEIQLPYVEGKVILVDKPLHWTSFDVVRKLRSLLQIKKIGHAGTLDPLATGLLIVCTGKFTKKINEFMAQQKEYTGTFTLGAITPTYDLESEPTQHQDYSFVTAGLLRETAAKLTGSIEQFPPIYSAIKKDGVALYELARRGEAVELKARPVTIYQFEITAIVLPEVSFKIVCSTGTYIRSMAHDFGAMLGCGAHLSSLRRTAIGDFTASQADSMEALEAMLTTTASSNLPLD
jgi:tRNA pseudouridine55 synthase